MEVTRPVYHCHKHIPLLLVQFCLVLTAGIKLRKWMSQKVPKALCYVLVLLHLLKDLESEEALDFVELFSGEGMVTRGLREQNLRGSPFEIRHHPSWDFNSPAPRRGTSNLLSTHCSEL